MMDIQNTWKADKWAPEALMQRYVKAGAKYFVSLACHHDNLDCFDSSHHAWNSLRVGPKRDVVGTWEKAARAAGLKFGVRSEEHTSELQSLMRISYAVFCLKKKRTITQHMLNYR